MKCANGCGRDVDALHMSDEGYCPDCFDRIIDIIVSSNKVEGD